eukprot:118104_1
MPLDITFTAGSDPITFSTCNSDANRDAYLYYGGKACNPAAGNNPSGCSACANGHETWTKTFPAGERVMQFYWYGGSGQSYYHVEMICGSSTDSPTTTTAQPTTNTATTNTPTTYNP